MSDTTDVSTLILKPHDPIVIQSPTLGELTFKWITIGSLQQIESFRDGPLPDRDFTIRVLHTHLDRPKLAVEALQSLNDTELASIVTGWAASPNTLDTKLSGEDVAVDFRRAMDTYFVSGPGAQSLRRISAEMARVNREMATLRPVFDTMRAIGPALELKAFVEAQNRLKLYTAPVFYTSFLQAIRDHRLVYEPLKVEFARIGQITADALAIQARTLAHIRIPDYMQGASAQLDRQLTLIGKLDRVSLASEAVLRDWSRQPALMTSAPPIIRDAPAVQLHDSSLITAVATHTDRASDALQDLAARETRTTPDLLQALLEEWNPELLKVLRGATGTLHRRADDYRRHHAASLRELMRAALHALAPDTPVMAWIAVQPDAHKSDLLDDNARPTRRARIAYVCDTAGLGAAFPAFVAQAVSHYIAVTKFLNAGTHRVGGSADEIHAEHVLMQRRAEDLLLLLITVKRGA